MAKALPRFIWLSICDYCLYSGESSSMRDKIEIDQLPTHGKIKIAIKQINIGRTSGLDGLPVELLNCWKWRVKMFSLLEWISFIKLLGWWCFSVFVERQRKKKELLTTTVESLFWMQLARFFPKSCWIERFESSILKSFPNHKVVLDLTEEKLTWYFRWCRRGSLLNNGSFCIRFLLIWQKILIHLTGMHFRRYLENKVSTNICQYTQTVFFFDLTKDIDTVNRDAFWTIYGK